MTGIILSGGKNIRMGTNKAFIKVDGERLIDRTVRLFKDIFEEVILVTNSPLEYLDQDVKIVTDIIKGKSAMGGVFIPDSFTRPVTAHSSRLAICHS